MSEDQFEQRGQVLEDMFFYKSDQALIEKMRKDLAAQEARDQLATLSGISDDHLLDSLVAHDVKAETLACVTLIPLVVVAWADGKLDEEERLAVMRAVQEKGLSGNEAAIHLVESWLKEKPGDDLFETWHEYITVLSGTLKKESYEQLREQVLQQAREVAYATGGFLGVVNSESRSEKLMLAKLEEAFA